MLVFVKKSSIFDEKYSFHPTCTLLNAKILRTIIEKYFAWSKMLFKWVLSSSAFMTQIKKRQKTIFRFFKKLTFLICLVSIHFRTFQNYQTSSLEF